MEQICENCKLYQAFYRKDEAGVYYERNDGECWVRVVSRKRKFFIKNASDPACEYFEARESEPRKTITCHLSTPDNRIIGNCVLLVKDLA